MNIPHSSRLWNIITAYIRSVSSYEVSSSFPFRLRRIMATCLAIGGLSMVVVGRMLVGYCTQLTRRVFGIPRRMRRNKIYRADSMPGTSYCIEMADHDPHDQVAYMTAYGSDVAPGDLIVLREGKATVTYWVKEIDYYSNPSDLWTALIVRCW